MGKLPSEIRLRIARETKSSVWKIDELLDVIKKEVEARELSEFVRASEEKGSKPTRKVFSTAKSLVANQQKPVNEFKIQCVYCNRNHYSASWRPGY